MVCVVQLVMLSVFTTMLIVINVYCLNWVVMLCRIVMSGRKNEIIYDNAWVMLRVIVLCSQIKQPLPSRTKPASQLCSGHVHASQPHPIP